MKGIIFNLLEEVVRNEYGDDTWDAWLEAAQLDGVYTSVGSYPEQDLIKLVTAAAATLEMPADAVVRWFGHAAVPVLAEKYPQFFDGHQSTRSFLLTLNDIIHPEVRKIYPGADVPEFDYDTTSSDQALIMGYKSTRRLCALAEGFIAGTTAYYGETLTFDQPQCMKRGDSRCEFRITFNRREP